MHIRKLPLCDTFWGSHGCDLEAGHKGSHQCFGCCDAWEVDGAAWIQLLGEEPHEYGSSFFSLGRTNSEARNKGTDAR